MNVVGICDNCVSSLNRSLPAPAKGFTAWSSVREPSQVFTLLVSAASLHAFGAGVAGSVSLRLLRFIWPKIIGDCVSKF